MKYLFFYFAACSLYIFAETTNYVSHGELHSFWKNEPVIGRWLSQGQGLMKIPDYLQNSTFSYRLRPYKQEVPFADSLTVVRLLGGWDYSKKRGELDGQKEGDLVYIDNHKLHYRWDLLKKRLNHYINAGYQDLTLVLDNIPWDLPKKPKLDKMGQVNPPHNLQQWETFIEVMMTELVRIYGNDIVQKFRFRLGTENQSRHRFNGTHDDYVNLYMRTQKAIHKVLPQAKIAPFNLAGRKTQLSKSNVDMYKFMQLMTVESNMSKPEVDFLPVSTYYVVRKKHKKGMRRLLDARTIANRRYYEALFEASNKVMPKEVHEFGVLNDTIKGIHSDEPGARGAAWRMYMIQNMMQNNISKLYHWDTFDRVAKNKYLLKSNGWLYSVLEHLVGGEAYSLPTVSKESYHYKTLLVKKNKKVYLFTTAFPDRKDESFSQNITISVPLELLAKNIPQRTSWTYLTHNTSVIDVIHSDLLAKGLLDSAFLKDLNVVGRVKDMGGQKFVREHWDTYVKTITDSLTLKPFFGEIKIKKNRVQVDINISMPSVSIIELSF